jgi:vitamin B12 transporter
VRAFLLCVGLVAMCTTATSLAAQWSGEVLGEVVDVGTGQGLPVASVTALDGTLHSTTDAGGGFHLRGLPEGVVEILFERLGYRSETRRLNVRNGRVHRITVQLTPLPLQLPGLTASVLGRSSSAATLLDRSDILESGARTLGEALEKVAGLVLRADRPGGTETLSIRGSAAGAVLVLVDGVPLNDPITGVADLSSVLISSVSSVEVVRGAQSTAFGSGARAGVVLVRTRAGDRSWRLSSALGSLGDRSAEGDFGVAWSGWKLSFGGRGRRVGGAFAFDQPAAVGGGRGERDNADARQFGVWTSADGDLGGGRLSLRISAEDESRGLPGKSFIPSPAARSEVRRGRGSVGWTRSFTRARAEWVGFAHLTRIRTSDTAPPLGLPFDDRSQVLGAGVRGNVAGETDGALARWSAGMIMQTQWVDSEALSQSVPDRRTDASLSLGAQSGGLAGSSGFALGALAVHRDPSGRRARFTHMIGLEWGAGGFRIGLQNRSSFSPPTLADQFFREGVAVAPNPDLDAERVPSEFEINVGGRWAPGAWVVSLSAAAYDGDVNGMIVWAPDFRFVWSPRNIDVNRRGLDLSATLEAPLSWGRLEARVAYGLAEVNYRRADPSQVAYRPRHSGAFGLTARAAAWTVVVDVTLTGARFPVPSPVNELPAFPVTDLRVARTLRWGERRIEVATHVRRLLNRTDNLIFGFPHPGRTIDFSLGVRGFGSQ